MRPTRAAEAHELVSNVRFGSKPDGRFGWKADLRYGRLRAVGTLASPRQSSDQPLVRVPLKSKRQ